MTPLRECYPFACSIMYPRYFAIALAVGLAALSIIFIGLAHDNGWSGGSTCSMAESLCRRPSLMAIPVFATMAWGLMLTMLTDR
jgi:hypothetical protein